MIESRTWGYFQPTRSGFDQQANPSPPRLEPDENGDRDSVLVISQAAAKELTSGRLPFEAAERADLLYLDAPSHTVGAIGLAFTKTYPMGEFSSFVCTEVA
ncbi:hypothetical protein DdX_22033 [Ditylenchus destructor]|uniref:Uncharacterized protein n=1 Tax=Ditylenchus destructor TaxID=166010 RepID=A0AAD4MET8_9BILA|nr:hypothetical protein DdX_22033 [Ditylenchus destructor]